MGFKFNTLLRAILAGAASRTYPATFNVLLSNPVGCTISDSSIAVTIQSNPIIPRVSLSRTTGKAPLAVGFDATTTTSPLTTNPNHDLFYAWSFGDAAGETWAYGATVGLDKNAAYGPVAGHVFKTDGTFNWTLTVMDGLGNIATSTGTITVSAWTTSDTIYIANGVVPTAGANGVPVGATNLYNETTWAGVVSRWAANKRIMLRKGDTWACGAMSYLPTGCEVNAYGTGANPIVTSAGTAQTPFGMNTGPSDVRVCNVKHIGPGPNVIDSGMVYASLVTPTHILMLGLESDGSTFGFLNSGETDANEVFIQDCYFHRYGDTGETTDTTNYAVYVTHGYGLYLLGSSFYQSPSHLVRVSGGQRVVVDSCKFLKPSTGIYPRHALTIREISNGASATWLGQYTEKVVVSNNDIDSTGTISTYTVDIGQTGPAYACRIRNVLLERNTITSDYQPVALAVRTGLTVRSNIVRCTDTAVAIGWGCSNTIANDGGADDPRAFSDGQFYNNTVYKTGTGSFSPFHLGTTESGTTVADAVVRNNLVYAPNATSPTLLLIGVGVTGTVDDHNSSDTQMLSTRPWAAVTPSVPSDYTPTGYALGGGVFDYRSQKDFFNAAITVPVDLGAIQA